MTYTLALKKSIHEATPIFGATPSAQCFFGEY